MIQVPGHPPSYRRPHRALLPRALRACGIGTWGRFAEIFANYEDKEVLTFE